jgi:hypothetical protein
MGILDSLFNTKYLVFLDIEFQTIQSNGQNPYILELGIIIFEHDNDSPILIDHVNFPLLDNDNLRLLNSKYCTVTEKTEIEMKKLESELYINVNDIESIRNKQDLIEFIPDRKIRKMLKEVIKTNNITLILNPIRTQKIIDQMYFNFFKYRMKGKYKYIFDQITKSYKNDDLVKKRFINPFNYLNTLKPYFNSMTLVHKEGMDIIALNNDLKKYNVKIESRIYHKDIAVYNKIFSKKYKTAKLYDSYISLKKDYSNKINLNTKNSICLFQFEKQLEEKIKEKMPVIKAHNPLSDVYFTIYIFILLEKFYKL